MADDQLSIRNDWFRVWMPYQFVKMDVAGQDHVYLPINRIYKPVGVRAGAHDNTWVELGDYLHQAVIFAEDPHLFEDVWADPEHLYLYDDSPGTQATYFERLGRLTPRVVALYHPAAS